MSDTNQISNDRYVAYEYTDIYVKRDQATLYEDCYRNFGWNLTETIDTHYHPNTSAHDYRNGNVNVPNVTVNTNGTPPDTILMKFKRDSRVANKHEIDRLQQKCDIALSNLKRVEDRKEARSMGPALGIGIIGSIFLAFAIYNITLGNTVGAVILGILAFLGWGVGFFANSKIKEQNAVKMAPVVEQEFDVIHSTCEQAYNLLCA